MRHKKTREILEAAGNLAKLHTVMRHELEYGITEGLRPVKNTDGITGS